MDLLGYPSMDVDAMAMTLPVAIIGAGPVGLAAAAELVLRGEQPLVFEQGREVGASVREWAHVRLFSPWRFCLDGAARTLLARSDWSQPDGTGYPTGSQLVDAYLRPLAGLPDVARGLRLGAKVLAVGREGMDKMSSPGRDGRPFELLVSTIAGLERVRARAVIDASGTWRTPNPLGPDGFPAIGEPRARGRVHYRIPNVLGPERERYAGRRVMVVGRGHSAFNLLVDLVALKDREPETEIVWATRSQLSSTVFGG